MNTKEKLLEALDSFRRKVQTGEIVGLVLGGTSPEGYFFSRTVGQPPWPNGILVLQDMVAEARAIFLAQNNVSHDGGPSLAVAAPPGPSPDPDPDSRKTDGT